MPRTDLFIKVEIEHQESEAPDRVAAEICRALLKLYGVRNAEVSNLITRGEE